MFLFHHWFLLLFFGCFHLSNFLYRDCWLFLYRDFLCQVLRFCVVVPRVLESFFERASRDLKELLLLSGVFYLTLFSYLWRKLLLSRLPREPEILLWRFQGLPLKFEAQARPICLFESHGVQQMVLVTMFYLCSKTLRNTISTSSGFRIKYL